MLLSMKRLLMLLPVLLPALTTHVASARTDPRTVKVFILAGQSNMEGHGKAELGRNPEYTPRESGVPREIEGGIGGLRWYVGEHPGTYGANGTMPLVDADGNWLVRDDVWVYTNVPGRQAGPLAVGFGKGEWFGPEFGFGHVVGNAVEEPVLIIKTAWGGVSLADDFRPPSSGASPHGGDPANTGTSYRAMMSTVRHVVDNLDELFPALAGRRVELAGFGWHQGWNDGDAARVAEYESNMVHFIRDVRNDLGVDALSFVIANTGMVGLDATGPRAELCEIQIGND